MAQVNAVGVYDWKPIYQELATKLLQFQGDRKPASVNESESPLRGIRNLVQITVNTILFGVTRTTLRAGLVTASVPPAQTNMLTSAPDM